MGRHTKVIAAILAAVFLFSAFGAISVYAEDVEPNPDPGYTEPAYNPEPEPTYPDMPVEPEPVVPLDSDFRSNDGDDRASSFLGNETENPSYTIDDIDFKY